MILTSTDIIRIVTTSTADIQVQAGWADITTTTFGPNRTNTIVTSIGTSTIVGSPAVSTQRQIKSIIIANRHASVSNTVTVQYYDGSISISVFKRTLLAGESLEYDGSKWGTFNVNGQILQTGGIDARGNDTQIQFNDGGVLSASSNFTFTKTTNSLKLLGTNTGVDLKAITTEPSTPSAGILHVYSKSVAGKIMLKQVGPSGLDTPLQNAIWQNNTVLFTPGAAAGNWQGTVGTNLGNAGLVLPTVTNVATMLRRSTFASVVTTTNQQVGTRTENMFYRGAATGIGGFHFSCRFMLATWTAGNRLFVGLSETAATIVTVDPSGLTNLVGFGIDAGNTAITFMYNDNISTATKDTIAGQPALATNNSYAAYIFCRPNDTVIYYRLDDLNAGVTIIDSSATTNLPINTTALCAQCIISNGANIVAGNATIGINRIYIETDL